MRDEYLPYRYLIAEILLDKQRSTIKTVINKIDDVGSTSQFRTFEYELLGGSPDMN
ncbi:tRNA(m(1)G37)methyltransferase, partial [Ascosphaera aggregata]